MQCVSRNKARNRQIKLPTSSVDENTCNYRFSEELDTKVFAKIPRSKLSTAGGGNVVFVPLDAVNCIRQT